MTPAVAPSVSYIAAFGGGVASFLSPCVLPIVPGYLSLVTGVDFASLEAGANRHAARILRETFLFIVGFGVVFTLLGVTATSVGRAIGRDHLLLTRITGAVVLAMAAFLLVSLVARLPFIYREARFHPDLSRFGPFAAPVAGAAFGFGWTPCIGPIFSSILAVAAGSGSPAEGATLLAVYSLGLGVPFLVVGLGFTRLTGALSWARRRAGAVTICSVVVLACFGVLLVMNRLTSVTSVLESLMRDVGLGRLLNLG
ncbi:MAG: cytochrome c biogenesis CcdA family protein [Acidimicrobiales bacterium]